jgi:hypothetical protein
MDHHVFPREHPRHDHIVYDEDQREYYNKHADIFLSDDDIAYYKLRPYDLITCPLPKPLPPGYFYNLEGTHEPLHSGPPPIQH